MLACKLLQCSGLHPSCKSEKDLLCSSSAISFSASAVQRPQLESTHLIVSQTRLCSAVPNFTLMTPCCAAVVVIHSFRDLSYLRFCRAAPNTQWNSLCSAAATYEPVCLANGSAVQCHQHTAPARQRHLDNTPHVKTLPHTMS